MGYKLVALIAELFRIAGYRNQFSNYPSQKSSTFWEGEGIKTVRTVRMPIASAQPAVRSK